MDILIEADQYWELVTGEVRRGNSGPVAIHTKFGWVLSGPISSCAPDAPAPCLVTHTLRVDSLSPESQLLDDRLNSSWELESFGVTDSDHSVYDDLVSHTLSPDMCSMSSQAFRRLHGDMDIVRLRVIGDDKKRSKENDLPVVSQEQRKSKKKDSSLSFFFLRFFFLFFFCAKAFFFCAEAGNSGCGAKLQIDS